MTDRTDVGETTSRPALPRRPCGPLSVAAALAVALHLLLLCGAAPFAGGVPERASAPMSVRSLAIAPVVEPVVEPAERVEPLPSAAVAAPLGVPKPTPPRRAPEPGPARPAKLAAVAQASASSAHAQPPSDALHESILAASVDPSPVAIVRGPHA